MFRIFFDIEFEYSEGLRSQLLSIVGKTNKTVIRLQDESFSSASIDVSGFSCTDTSITVSLIGYGYSLFYEHGIDESDMSILQTGKITTMKIVRG